MNRGKISSKNLVLNKPTFVGFCRKYGHNYFTVATVVRRHLSGRKTTSPWGDKTKRIINDLDEYFGLRET